MSTEIETASPSRRSACLPASPAGWPASKLNADLRLYFGVDFALWDGATGHCLRRGLGQPPGDELLQGCLVQTVARKAGPQLIGYEDSAVVLAIPWHQPGGACGVAVATFATGQPGTGACAAGDDASVGAGGGRGRAVAPASSGLDPGIVVAGGRRHAGQIRRRA